VPGFGHWPAPSPPIPRGVRLGASKFEPLGVSEQLTIFQAKSGFFSSSSRFPLAGASPVGLVPWGSWPAR